MDWSISDIARLAGTTSRTLRHYDHIGLLAPSRIGANGYRHYDEAALRRLQRILLLRELGLGLDAIAEALVHNDDVSALTTHVRWLREEQARIGRQIASVELTIDHREGRGGLMAHDMFDGFNHNDHREEVERRWGAPAWDASTRWWSSRSAAEKNDFAAISRELIDSWTAAAREGEAPDGAVAQELARRQYDWLRGIPGTPQTPEGRPSREYYEGLGAMYVAGERFAANYGGSEGATFVRDSMRYWADRNL